MMFAIDGYKFYVEFDNEAEARKMFSEVKTRFTRCELKRIDLSRGYYYAESIEVYHK